MASLDYHSNPLSTFKECSSCGALYNKTCACSKGGFVGKFVRDLNKTPDSSQRPPHNCPNCGDPVDGLYYRQCALLRNKLREIFDENEFFQDLLNPSESSNNKTNVVNLPQEPFVFNQDPGENSSQSPPHIDHHCCYECGDSLDGVYVCVYADYVGVGTQSIERDRLIGIEVMLDNSFRPLLSDGEMIIEI
ncbi:hypothetical protein Tco_0477463 [Tanacetum coccineum]